MVLKNVKVKSDDVAFIDDVKGDYPRNKIVSDAIKSLQDKSKIKLDIYTKDYVIRLLNSIENTVIIPIDKRTKTKREIDEIRRILGG
jgi:cell division septum initiation protein DivIVA